MSFLNPARGQTYEDEFANFMAESSEQLNKTAWLLTGDRHQAEELVQEALTRTFMSWRKARKDPMAYARKMLTTKRGVLKRNQQREPVMPQVPDTEIESSEGTIADRDRLTRALATLTERQREIVVLRHLMGLSEQQVADDLGCSVGTVKSTASRGLAQLREFLESSEEADAAA
ncbi:MAG: SigE family RNA polymerase sigma factor [Cellulomonadaceae bacterium]|nr:SigE family RNA polymerase sigma factor [Cellulomonadaceae bacterium]